MTYKLMVFDWDGTLVDSTGRIVDSLLRAGEDLDLPRISAHQAQSIIGLGLPEALATLWPQLKASQFEPMRERYSHYFIERSDVPMGFFAGIIALIEQLNTERAIVKRAVATGKSRAGLDRVLSDLDAASGELALSQWFHATRCADESRSKPAPDMLLELCEHFGVSPQETLMVGDTTFDLDMASAAGVDAIGVTYGAHDAERLEQSKSLGLCHTVQALTQQLMSF